MDIGRLLTFVDLYTNVDIFGVKVSVCLKVQTNGELSHSSQQARSKLETWILNDCKNTGFLLWFPVVLHVFLNKQPSQSMCSLC